MEQNTGYLISVDPATKVVCVKAPGRGAGRDYRKIAGNKSNLTMTRRDIIINVYENINT